MPASSDMEQVRLFSIADVKERDDQSRSRLRYQGWSKSRKEEGMRKEDLLKLGLEEELAAKVAAASEEELKGFVTIARLKEESKKVAGLESQIAEIAPKLEAAQKLSTELQAEKDHRVLVEEVAAAKEVPVSVLKGSTREELEAHADLIKPLIKTPAAPFVPSDGSGAGTPAATTADQFAEALDGII